MSSLHRLLPASADNVYHGPKATLYVFVVLALVMLGRSLVHLLAPDAGLNSIASLVLFSFSSAEPDPNKAIYLFGSLWGLHQVILAILYLVVAVRYRSLLPLMYLTLVIEWGSRIGIVSFLHPLGAAYFEHRPPGSTANLPFFLLVTAMFILSLRAPASSKAHA